MAEDIVDLQSTVQATPPVDPGYSVFLENSKLMTQIVREMREEIPDNDLISEKPNADIATLQKVEFPPNGGVYTWMSGHPYPYKGFPYYDFVDRVDLFKKISKNFLSGLYHALKGRNKLWFVLLIPGLWFLKPLIRTGIYIFYRIMDRYRLKPTRYSDAVREVYRAFSYKSPGESSRTSEFRIMIRNSLCLLLEFDNAYRYRFQDTIGEFNCENAQKNFAKEIVRLLDLMSSRERTQTVKDTWYLFRKFVPLYLRFDKELKIIIRDALFQLDLQKIKLDEIDIYYCTKRKDYIFGFMERGEKPIPPLKE